MLNPCDDVNDAQKWTFHAQSGGTWRIESGHTGLYIYYGKDSMQDFMVEALGTSHNPDNASDLRMSPHLGGGMFFSTTKTPATFISMTMDNINAGTFVPNTYITEGQGSFN